jgi:hypothetical protein
MGRSTLRAALIYQHGTIERDREAVATEPGGAVDLAYR